MTIFSGHETSLGQRGTLHRADVGRKVCESRIVCPTCSQEIDYFTERLYGRTLQACGCKVQLMQRSGDALKAFGPRHLSKPKRMRERVTPKATGKNVVTLKVCPECEQEFKCRERMNETGLCTKCSKRQYQREWRRQERARLAQRKQEQVA